LKNFIPKCAQSNHINHFHILKIHQHRFFLERKHGGLLLEIYQQIQQNVLASFLVSRLQNFGGIANFSSPKICWDKNLQMLSIFGIPGIGPTLAKAP
jgi:hypothetical protein